MEWVFGANVMVCYIGVCKIGNGADWGLGCVRNCYECVYLCVGIIYGNDAVWCCCELLYMYAMRCASSGIICCNKRMIVVPVAVSVLRLADIWRMLEAPCS